MQNNLIFKNDDFPWHPLLMHTEDIKAILAKRKSQFRKVINLKDHHSARYDEIKDGIYFFERLDKNNEPTEKYFYQLPPHEKFDRYYIQERVFKLPEGCINTKNNQPFLYETDFPEENLKWIYPLGMPKEAARIFIEIKSVRVERVQDISDKDLLAEGLSCEGIQYYYPTTDEYVDMTLKEAYENHFDLQNELGDWDKNPLVWVFEFDVIEEF